MRDWELEGCKCRMTNTLACCTSCTTKSAPPGACKLKSSTNEIRFSSMMFLDRYDLWQVFPLVSKPSTVA
eukprot:715497-Amphidinium_carterae.1